MKQLFSTWKRSKLNLQILRQEIYKRVAICDLLHKCLIMPNYSILKKSFSLSILILFISSLLYFVGYFIPFFFLSFLFFYPYLLVFRRHLLKSLCSEWKVYRLLKIIRSFLKVLSLIISFFFLFFCSVRLFTYFLPPSALIFFLLCWFRKVHSFFSYVTLYFENFPLQPLKTWHTNISIWWLQVTTRC